MSKAQEYADKMTAMYEKGEDPIIQPDGYLGVYKLHVIRNYGSIRNYILQTKIGDESE